MKWQLSATIKYQRQKVKKSVHNTDILSVANLKMLMSHTNLVNIKHFFAVSKKNFFLKYCEGFIT